MLAAWFHGRLVGAQAIDLPALQTMVDTIAKELMIPGAVVLLRTPQGEFTVTYGTTLLGATSPPRADTHFRIASNTKTMTAAVILLLAQEGKLSLDDPVSKYVPGVPNGDNITITELLNMRSGPYSYDDAPEFWAILDGDPTKVWSPAEVLAIAFKHPPYFPPGTDFHYSNTNYALLGLIAEKIDGKPLASCFQNRLFGPLGLKDTLLPAITSNTLPESYSHGYLYGGCSFSNLTDKPYPPDLQAAARSGTLKPDDCTGQNSSYASAAGGVISTANDLATWIQALVGGRVFNADYQRHWFDSLQPEVPSKPEGQKYGYGISQISWGPNTIYFHGGEMPRLQLENQLRPNQQADAHHLDQSDCITRRPADRQYPLREDARSYLRGVTAVALPIADEVYRQGSAALDLPGLTTEPVRALANALRTTHSTFMVSAIL